MPKRYFGNKKTEGLEKQIIPTSSLNLFLNLKKFENEKREMKMKNEKAK